ncbi:hypothetical protein LCGC14_0997620 [marine sediment metagenome]|uniref:Large polyvalent protein associated domain-containing protein n=1 Tax=marine sediment metagenome TaxID=412755 RepID=A0A0F9N417_9ZZZZ
MVNNQSINPKFKEAPTEFFSTESIGVQGVIEDLPGLEVNLDKIIAESDSRDNQSLIEQGIEKFGIPEPEKPDDIFSNIKNQLINSPMTQMSGGIRDALVNTIESLGDLIDMGFETSQLQQLSETGELDKIKVPSAGEAIRKVTRKIPEIPEADTTLLNIQRTAAQYAINFIPFMKGLNSLAKIPKIGRTLQSGIAGMLTAFTALDVDSPKFGEMIESLHPKLKIPFLDFLKSKPEDTNAEKRFKNAIDDALAFGAIGGLFFAMGKFVKRALALGRKLNETTIKPKGVKAAIPKASKPTTFESLGKRSDELEDVIENMRDELDAKGIKDILKQEKFSPELAKLVQEKIKIDTSAAQKAFDGAKKILQNVIGIKKSQSEFASIKSILRENYGLTDKPLGGAFFFRQIDSSIDNPQTIEKVTKDIAKILFSEKHPNADFFATFGSNAAGVTRKGKEDILKKASSMAGTFNNKLKTFLLSETAEPILKASKPSQLVEVTEKTGKKLKDFLEIKAEDVAHAQKELNLNFENWKVEDDIVTSLNKVATVFEEETKAMGRGVTKSRAELMKAVEKSGFGLEEMLKLNNNQPLNDAQIKSFVFHLHQIQKKLDTLKTAFLKGDKSVEEEFLKTFALSSKLVPKFLGAGSTAGRALKALDTIKQDFDGNLRVVKDLINATEEIPLGVNAVELARSLDMLTTVKGRSIFARTAVTASNMFMEAWIAGLVSGTKTLLGVNPLGNLNLLLFGVAERGLASGTTNIFSAGRRGIASQEAHYLVYGMINATDEALQVAGKTLRTGIQNPEFTKFEIPRQIRGDRVNLDFIDNRLTQNVLKKGIDLFGSIVRFPFTVLGSVDDFFKVMNTRGHLWSLGARKANSLGLDPQSDEWLRVVADVINNPTKAISEQANDFGHIQTFTNKLNKDKGLIEGVGATVTEFANKHALVKMVVPFSKIATNITKYSLERTPFAFAMKDVRDAIGRGGADRQMAYAKIALGSMIGMLFVSLAKMGLITGTFPTSSINQKKLRRDSGVDQNSWIIGGKSFPYRRIDPIGLTIGMSADFVELFETLGVDDLSKIATVISAMIGENVLNKTYLVGISDVVDVILGRRKPAKVLQRFASTLIPFSSAIRETERAFDPRIGQTNPNLDSSWKIFINGFMSGKPGENRYLMPKRGFFGDVLERGRYFDIKNIKDDKALNALIDNKVEVSFQPDRAISGRVPGRLRTPSAKDGIILEDPNYDRMIELFGKVEIGGLVVREAIEQFIETKQFKDAPKNMRAKILESIVRTYRDVAELKMLDEDEENGGSLKQRIRLKKIAEIRE